MNVRSSAIVFNVGGYQHLKAEQQGSADADLVGSVVLLCQPVANIKKGRPANAQHDDQHPKNFDTDANQTDPIPDRGIKIMHGRICPGAGTLIGKSLGPG